MKKVVSSAQITQCIGKWSFIATMKMKGPSTGPCGTPALFFIHPFILLLNQNYKGVLLSYLYYHNVTVKITM